MPKAKGEVLTAPPQPRGKVLKNQIIQAAKKLFAVDGYDAVILCDLTAAAGVSLLS